MLRRVAGEGIAPTLEEIERVLACASQGATESQLIRLVREYATYHSPAASGQLIMNLVDAHNGVHRLHYGILAQRLTAIIKG